MKAAESAATPGYAIDRESFVIRFERRVDAAASEVFDAWTQPEQVTEWWDPDGEPLVTCTIDLRVGGTFSFATRQHSQMPFAGVYREIDRPRRLVFEAMGATGTLALTESGGGTHMRVEIACQSLQQLEAFANMGVAAGTARTLDNLVAFVGGSRGK